MIDSRRMARPTRPSTSDPALSGPRWWRVSFIEARTAGSGLAAPSSDARPQIPHMRDESNDAGGRLWLLGVRLGCLVALEVERLLGTAPERASCDAPERLGDHRHVEGNRAVGDVFEVVG